MAQHHSDPIRDSDPFAAEGSRPRAPDVIFTAGLSLAIFAGFALGFAF